MPHLILRHDSHGYRNKDCSSYSDVSLQFNDQIFSDFDDDVINNVIFKRSHMSFDEEFAKCFKEAPTK